MKYPHLLAAAVAVLLVIAIVAMVTHEAREYEAENERSTAQLFFPQKITGSALQRLAFKMGHYLPIYGSSELGSYELQKRVQTKPGDFFINAPTGFKAYPVGRGGTTPLVMLQELAAAGPQVRGHKVVIVLSPNWFAGPLNVSNYEGNATLLHTGSLLFGRFSPELKHDAARRLAQFPAPLEKSELLKTATAFAASDVRWQRDLSRLLNPMGRGWLFSLQVMDNFETVRRMLDPTRHLAKVQPEQRRVVNWPEEIMNAESVSDVEASWVGHDPESGEPVVNPHPSAPLKMRKKPGTVQFESSEVWGDYDLLLRTLHELGAKALVLSVPMDGPIEDKNNVPFARRDVYYQRVRQMAAKYGYPARTFEEHEYDGNFLIEHVSHLTDKGWLFFDQVIDAFYHDKS
ncbi:MAG: D-alanyl-lipoteichoic acid biosynthesis protein DltD [Chthoniobacterales bacterium]